MKSKFFLCALLTGALGCAVAAPRAELDPETVLLENGRERVTVRDLDAAMTKFPEALREEARAYPSVIMKNIDAIFVNRVAADRARALGLDKDPLVQQRMLQLQEAFLAQKYLDHVYAGVKVPDLSARAEEIYKSDPKRFVQPATVTFSDIVVGLRGRTKEMAIQRAAEAEARLRAGEDFATVGQQYSDDPNFAKHKGNLGDVKEADLEASLRKGIADLKPGEISRPIATDFGVHVVKLAGRKPERQQTLAEARQTIIDEETEKLRKRAAEDFLTQTRIDPKNTIYKDRVEATRSQIDTTQVDKVHQDAIQKIHSQ